MTSGSSITVSKAGKYTIYVVDNKGCSIVSDTVKVYSGKYVPIGVPIVAGSNPVCPGSASELTASATGGIGNYSYLWSTGLSGASVYVYPEANTWYVVTVTDQITSVVDSIEVDTYPLPVANISPVGPISLTPGDSVKLTVTFGVDNWAFLWENDYSPITGYYYTSTGSIWVKQAGYYTVYDYNTFYCSN